MACAGKLPLNAIPPLWDGHTAERIVEILFSERAGGATV